ncbi:MAG: Fe-S protein assembly co-chaperone HscB [Betaproteobacteria bacterium RIFCSPLOWO2_02_FULL_62_17]|nr:MAG: Fe-S protein assembly co-chaperone HscB [Betaproteobacteria bacterium RIFCSPLOWO2_02_FULL_62_17]
MTQARNHFELLGLAASYTVSADVMDRSYREILSKVHPDRFASASDAERRAAMQLATQVNEAYQTLKHPLKRAIYFLELAGVDVLSQTSAAMEPAFLMRQLEWRENIEDARAARNAGRLESLRAELESEKRERFARLEALFGSGATQPAAEAARQLLFIDKLEQAIGDGIESLETA